MFLLLQTTHRMVIRHEPDVGHLYMPNARARIPHERGAFYVATNSQGFRSDIEFATGKSTRPRILFFGDSFTAGDGCSNRERFPELVGDALGAEVYNYAVSGTGTDQQLLIYEKFARGVAADLIVFCVYVENIERNKVAFRESIDRFTKRRLLVPKPYFTLDGGALALHHVPVPLDRPFVEETGKEAFQGLERTADPLQALIYKPLQRLKGNRAHDAVRAAVKQRLPWLMPAVFETLRLPTASGLSIARQRRLASHARDRHALHGGGRPNAGADRSSARVTTSITTVSTRCISRSSSNSPHPTATSM